MPAEDAMLKAQSLYTGMRTSVLRCRLILGKRTFAKTGSGQVKYGEHSTERPVFYTTVEAGFQAGLVEWPAIMRK